MSDVRAMRMGVDKLHIAVLTKDDGTVAPTWATPENFPGLMKIGINPNTSTETAFFDDGAGDTAATLGSIEIEIEKNALSTAEQAILLGHALDSNGAIVYGANDVAPYVAVGFRSMKSNGKYRYAWVYKVKFVDGEDNNETKGENIQFQNDTIKGKAVKLNWEYTIGSNKAKPWKIAIDEEDSGTKITGTIAKWFTKVIQPNESIT